jgi:mannose-1-phosphate guanylyltransferase
MPPSAPASDYGWIVPAGDGGTFMRVRAFVEKPEPAAAARLLQEGALWNSFVLVVRARAMAACLKRCLSLTFHSMREAALRGHDAVVRLYEELPAADLSRDVLQRSPADLRVLPVPSCGWTDVGTPLRLAECLAALRPARATTGPATPATSGRQLLMLSPRAPGSLRTPAAPRP